jgi:hypothetical protein
MKMNELKINENKKKKLNRRGKSNCNPYSSLNPNKLTCKPQAIPNSVFSISSITCGKAMLRIGLGLILV